VERDERSEDVPMGVHKDFHLLTATMIEYLERTYGCSEMRDYLRRLATTVYQPLIATISDRGLTAVREHFTRVFDREQGQYQFSERDSALELRVMRCPAVWHLKDKGEPIPSSFCEQTRTVLGEICRIAGIGFTVDFDTDRGTCTQIFKQESVQ